MTVLVDGVESPCFNAWVNTSRIWNQGRYDTELQLKSLKKVLIA